MHHWSKVPMIMNHNWKFFTISIAKKSVTNFTSTHSYYLRPTFPISFLIFTQLSVPAVRSAQKLLIKWWSNWPLIFALNVVFQFTCNRYQQICEFLGRSNSQQLNLSRTTLYPEIWGCCWERLATRLSLRSLAPHISDHFARECQADPQKTNLEKIMHSFSLQDHLITCKERRLVLSLLNVIKFEGPIY